MQSHQYEEITFVLCESCCEFILEETSLESDGVTCCADCAGMEVLYAL